MATTKPKPKLKQPTNADLAEQMRLMEVRTGRRLDKIELTIKHSGLNGHTDLLREFLDTYSSERDQKQAYSIVRVDITRRLRWLATPKKLLSILAAGVITGIGYGLTSGGIHFPHL